MRLEFQQILIPSYFSPTHLKTINKSKKTINNNKYQEFSWERTLLKWREGNDANINSPTPGTYDATNNYYKMKKERREKERKRDENGTFKIRGRRIRRNNKRGRRIKRRKQVGSVELNCSHQTKNT